MSDTHFVTRIHRPPFGGWFTYVKDLNPSELLFLADDKYYRTTLQYWNSYKTLRIMRLMTHDEAMMCFDDEITRYSDIEVLPSSTSPTPLPNG